MFLLAEKTNTDSLKKMPITYFIYNAISEIPASIFQNTSNPYLSFEYLQLLEVENSSIGMRYIVINEGNECIAVAVIQILSIKLSAPYNPTVECFIMKEVILQLSKFGLKKLHKILVCGNIFIAGENGFLLMKPENENFTDYFASVLEKALKDIAKQENANLILFKDFRNMKDAVPQMLQQKNYRNVSTEPTMVLTIDESWKTFDDYLLAMKTKYRTKAKKALTESAVLLVKDLNYNDIMQNINEFSSLYEKVENKASFSLGRLNLATYISMKQKFPEKFIFKSYSFNNKIVGFMTAFQNNNTLDAHYIGLDYEVNKELYLYQRILYDYVEVAIERGLKYVNYGRSAGEIKSSVGAMPIDLFCCMKHLSVFHNTFLKPLVEGIKPNNFKITLPFK